MNLSTNVQILDCLPWAVVRLNPELKVLYANAAARTIFNWKGEDKSIFLHEITWVDHRGNPVTNENHPVADCFRRGNQLSKQILGFSIADSKQITWIEAHCIPEFKDGYQLPVQVCFTFTETARPPQSANTDNSQGEALAEKNTASKCFFELDILDRIGQAVIVTDLQGTILYTNKAATKIYGWTKEEFLKKNVLDTTVPDAAFVLAKGILENLLKGESWCGEFEVKRKDGTIFPAFVTDSPLYNEYGKLAGIIRISSDITERKLVEEKLMESEEKSSLFIKQAPVSIAMFDREMKYLAVSKRWLFDFNLIEEDIIGKSHYEVFPEISEEWKSIHRRGMNGEIISDDNDRFERLDGTVQYLRWELMPWYNAANEVGGIVLFTEDVTEKKNAQNKLIESEKNYRNLFNNSPDGYLIIKNGIFIDCNKASEQIIGGHRSQIIGKSPDMLSPEYQPNGKKSVDYARELINQTFIKGRNSFEWVHTKFNGTEFTAQVNLSVIEQAGEKLFFTTWQDITEKSRTLRDLQKSEKRFRSLFENMTQGVVYMNAEGFITAANNAALEMLGLTLDQMQGRTSADPRWKAIKEDGSNFPGHEHPAMVTLTTGKTLENSVMGVYHPVEEKYRWIKIHSTPVFKKGVEKPAAVFTIFDDITLRREAEEALKESELLFRSVFNSMFSFTAILNREGKILNINESALKYFNLNISDFINKYIFDLAWWKSNIADYSHMIKTGLEKVALGDFWRKEIKLTDDVGNAYFMDITMKPIRNQKGDVIGIIQESREITQLRKQEENARILNRMFQKSTSGVLIADARHPDMPLIDVNEAFTRITGYTKEEAIGKNCRFLQGEYQNQPNLEIIRKAIKEEKECRVELMNFRKSGEMFWNELYLAPVHDNEGVLTHYVGIQNDVTERKKEQQELENYRYRLEEQVEQRTRELQVSQDKLVLTQQMTQMGSWETKPEEDEAVWSDETYKIFERDIQKGPYNFEEFMNTIVPEDREIVLKFLSSTPAPDEINTYTIRQYTDKGNLIWVKYFGKSVFKNGKLAFNMGSLLDITQEKLTQMKLNEAVKAAEEANKAKSIFLANMSHEIRTPLNSIIGFSELLYNSVSDDKKRSQVESIRNSGRSLLKIINDILDLSKVEAGKIIIEKEPLDVFKLVREVGGMFEQKAAEKQIDLTIESLTDLTAPLMLDETRLRQILFNLVGNAFKFTVRGKIAIHIVHEEKENQQVNLQIRIIDTGTGIAEDQFDVIFEPFVQQQGQAQKTYGGTGLGLAISQRLAKAMDGEIRVKSMPGEGSEFTVYLKNVSKAEVHPTEIENKFAVYSNVRFHENSILIVDDIADNRKLLWDVLEFTGARLLEAENGAEAVRLARMEKPDIILMDLRMPVMDGAEAVQLLKQGPETADIPCIAVSASLKLGNSEKEIPENFEDFLMKPVDFNQLFDKLLRQLKHHKVKLQPADNKVILSKEADKKWPDDLIQFAEEKLVPLYQRVMKKQLVDEIEEFGKQLVSAGKRFDDEMLVNIGKKLGEYADLFDVDKLTQTMHEFQFLLNRKLK